MSPVNRIAVEMREAGGEEKGSNRGRGSVVEGVAGRERVEGEGVVGGRRLVVEGEGSIRGSSRKGEGIGRGGGSGREGEG